MEEEYRPIYQVEEDLKNERIKRIMQRRKEWDAKKGINKEKVILEEKNFPTLNIKEDFPTLGSKQPNKTAWNKKVK